MPDIPSTMHAVLLTGHGGFEMLDYRTDVPVPSPGPGEVLINVTAAGVNNTDINTRIGWYSKKVTEGTNADATEGVDDDVDDDGSWGGTPLQFPRIQGADIAGRIVAVGEGIDERRVGERVLVRTMLENPTSDSPVASFCVGSESDGGFAQFAVIGAVHAFAIDCDLTDAELASFPCAWSTAENMLHRSSVGAGERVLITGASGGVGSAAVQLVKRRGAEVIAVASKAKWADVEPLGADQMLDRNDDVVAELGADSVDVVVDLVAGPNFPALLDVLKPGGRYVTSGAIGGPIVDLDVRTLYLKDLALLGGTYQPPEVFENLVGYIERGEVRPVVSATWPLDQIVEAQQAFLNKTFTGKLVLIPPPID